MVLQRFDLVQTGALFDLSCERLEVLLIGRGHFEYVVDAVEDDDENLRVFSFKQLTEGNENAKLENVGNLFTFTAQAQIVDAPRGFAASRKIALE